MEGAEKLNTIRKIDLDLVKLVLRLEYLTPEIQDILNRLCENTRALYSAISDDFYNELEAACKDVESS